MNCGTCKHWNLDQPMGAHGFGACEARSPAHRAGVTTPPEADCRIGKFVKAEMNVLRARESKLGGLLL